MPFLYFYDQDLLFVKGFVPFEVELLLNDVGELIEVNQTQFYFAYELDLQRHEQRDPLMP